MSFEQVYVAATRFGFGARPGELTKYKSNPRSWLLNQLEDYNPNPAVFSDLPDFETIGSTIASMQGRENARNRRQHSKEVIDKELSARMINAVTTKTSFVERLVHFWSNHFTISIKKERLIAIAGLYEREAIRPHVLGRFEDMLLACEQHIAMLIYLDNHMSIGENSRAARDTDRGINENLAREILELHTLGVDGGYTQSDVIALSKIITGWSGNREEGFVYRKNWHEPGDHVLLGRRYSQKGHKQGIAALKDLARHPSTAKFIATKLAHHFISDTPSDWAIRQISNTFKNTNGDLKQVAQTLVNLNEAWKLEPGKIKSANDYVISAARAVGSGSDVNTRFLLQSLRAFGQFPFNANSPAGYSDKSSFWSGPDVIMKRIEWSKSAAKKLMTSAVDNELANQIIHPVLKPESYQLIKEADSKQEALAMLFALPEFQRR